MKRDAASPHRWKLAFGLDLCGRAVEFLVIPNGFALIIANSKEHVARESSIKLWGFTGKLAAVNVTCDDTSEQIICAEQGMPHMTKATAERVTPVHHRQATHWIVELRPVS